MFRSTLKTATRSALLSLAVFVTLPFPAHAFHVWEHSVVGNGGGVHVSPGNGGGLHVMAARRGDVDLDGRVTLVDATRLADWLHAGGAQPLCLQTCDRNRDGRVDLKDVSAIVAVAEGLVVEESSESLLIFITPRFVDLNVSSFTAVPELDASGNAVQIIEVRTREDRTETGCKTYVISEPFPESAARVRIEPGDTLEIGSQALAVYVEEISLVPPVGVIGPGIGIGFADASEGLGTLTIRFEDKTGSEEIH